MALTMETMRSRSLFDHWRLSIHSSSNTRIFLRFPRLAKTFTEKVGGVFKKTAENLISFA